MVWPKMYHFFQLHREEFDRRYHARSNVEAVFSAVQRKLGEGSLAKNPLVRFNELPAKLLAYDIGILVHEIYENGIDPATVGLPPKEGPAACAPVPTRPPIRCDSIPSPVTQFGESI